MHWVLFAVVILLLIALVVVMGGPERYAKMSEKEFEGDAERKSLLGAAMVGVEEALRPERVEQVLEQKKRVEKDAARSGDKPSAEKTSNGRVSKWRRVSQPLRCRRSRRGIL